MTLHAPVARSHPGPDHNAQTDDEMLDALGARRPVRGTDPLGALLQAWVTRLDRTGTNTDPPGHSAG